MTTKAHSLSRRAVLLGATGTLAACSAPAPRAMTGMDGGTHPVTDAGFHPGTDATEPTDGAVPVPDSLTLNTLLTAEYLALAAYVYAGGILSAPPAGDPLASNASQYAAMATHWAGHHQTHVSVLGGAVSMAGGTPVQASTVPFVPPTGFTPSVINALKLLANTERGLSIAHGAAVATLVAQGWRFLASSLCGDETQHLVVLDALVLSVLGLGPAVATMGPSGIVPTAFLSTYGSAATGVGFESIPDFAYM